MDAEIKSFPNRETLDYLVNETRQACADLLDLNKINIEELEYIDWHLGLIINHQDFQPKIIFDIVNIITNVIGRCRADDIDIVINHHRHIAESLVIITQQKHPSYAEVRRNATSILYSVVKNRQPFIELTNSAQQIQDIINEIAVRELPEFNGFNEPPEVTLRRLWVEHSYDEFLIILRAYCDSYGVSYDNLLE